MQCMVEFSEKYLCMENALKDPMLHILIEKIHLQDQTRSKKRVPERISEVSAHHPQNKQPLFPESADPGNRALKPDIFSISALKNRMESCILFNSRHLEYIRIYLVVGKLNSKLLTTLLLVSRWHD